MLEYVLGRDPIMDRKYIADIAVVGAMIILIMPA